MRRKERELTALEDKMAVIQSCKVLRLAMIDGGKPYIVPLNYGFKQLGDTLYLYFHSATEGKKLEALQQNPSVCFEMDTDHQLVEDEIPCRNGFLFSSIVGEGTVEFLEDLQQKKDALNQIMLHQTGKKFEYSDNVMKFVAVARIKVDSFTGKRRDH